MTISGESKVFKHGKAKTLYIAIPADVVKDSRFPDIKDGDKVTIWIDDEEHDPAVLVISKKED